jgi:hypothetical protein
MTLAIAQDAFECERTAFHRARDCGHALEMRSVAGSMLRHARRPDDRFYALQSRADANIRLGRTTEAMEQLDDLPLKRRLVCDAKLSLLAGNLGEAAERARAGLETLGDSSHECFQCLELISEIALARSAHWLPPRGLPDVPVWSWERTAMEVEQARHFVAQRRWSAAERLARTTLARAETFGYEALAARSAAVLYAAANAAGDRGSGHRWRADAVFHLLRTQDRALATGLLVRDPFGDETAVDGDLSLVLYERLCLIVPQMLGEAEDVRERVRELIVGVICGPSNGASPPYVRDMLAGIVRADCALAHYAMARVEPIVEMLTLAFVALTGSAWHEASHRMRTSVEHAASRLRPSIVRTIPVAVPPDASQLRRTKHLRVHDELSCGLAGQSETGTDLRVRLVPI